MMMLRSLLPLPFLLLATLTASGGTIRVSNTGDDPVLRYAERRLQQAFAENPDYPDSRVTLELDAALGAEAYRSTVDRPDGELAVDIRGGDSRGLLYGSLTLLEQLRNGGADAVVPAAESARFPFRAIKFNLPYMAYRSGEALSVHAETCRDPGFWEAWLDQMAENRFNTLTLWSLHPFHLMIRNSKYPEACDLDDAELADWQGFWRQLFAMAKERGIDTYIVNWNIFVSPAFARHHGVAKYSASGTRNYIGKKSDTSELVADYNRSTFTQVLDTYPNLTGIGVSLGEQMGGMTPEEREQWILDVVVAGIKAAGRPARLIHRLPFSADKGSGGSTSASTEQLTRAAIEGIDLPGPIETEVKFNWSHAHSTPELVHVHGGPIGDTYWNPEPKNYRINWMVRNEDFFSLRWAEPDFIREHIRLNGHPYVGGYYLGSECYIPAKDYLSAPGYEQPYAFDRQWLYYMVWGRLLYNPELPEEAFVAACRARYGDAGEPLFHALKLASRMPLRLASFYRSTWDFTLYSEGFMSFQSRDNPQRMISIDDLIKRPVLDPDYVNIRDFVRMTANGKPPPEGRITPLELAEEMLATGDDALDTLAGIPPAALDQNPALFAEVADVRAWSHLCRYFGHKLQAAVALERFRQTGDDEQGVLAVENATAMLSDWQALCAVTGQTHRVVPLAHIFHQQDLDDDPRRFHWQLLLPTVEAELEQVRRETRN